jgi:shikimate dehydrogenase
VASFFPEQSSIPFYCVIGDPVHHSRSPRIHASFAAQLGISLRYEAVQIPAHALPQALAEFRALGGKGMNVTIPHKQAAYALAEVHSPQAAAAGATNTLTLDRQGRFRADNTDGIGLLRDLEKNLGICLAQRHILLLGAGGAARGVVGPLLAAHPAGLTIVNKTPARALELKALFAAAGPVTACGYPDLPGRAFDLLINATSASLQGEMLPLEAGLLRPGACCYDMMYAEEPTPFRRWGMAHGAAQAVDGLGMLVEQAAGAFLIWHGIMPDTAPVLAALRAGWRVPVIPAKAGIQV